MPYDLVSDSMFISVYLINARSLVNKIDLLRYYLCEYRPAIVCITESWAHAGLSDSFFFIKDYFFYRCDRTKGAGGGVAIYVSKTLSSLFVSSLDDEKATIVTCLVSSQTGENLNISCVYIPPGYTLTDSLAMSYLNDVVNRNDELQFFCGDFNRPDIDWSILQGSSSALPLLDWCMDNFLSQKVLTPTRPISNTVLDLVFTTDDSRVCGLSVNECFGTSDHAIVSFSIPLWYKACHKSGSSEFIFSKANWKHFQRCLHDCSWPSLVNNNCVNLIWEQYLSNIKSAARRAIPAREKKSWTPPNASKVRSILRKHRRLSRQYTDSPTVFNRSLLNYSLSVLNSAVKQTVLRHEHYVCSEILTNSNCKPFWSYIRSRLKTQTQFSAIVDENGVSISQDRDIANSFNRYFASNFNQLTDFRPQPTSNTVTHTLETVRFTPEDTFKVIQGLSSSKSTDADGVCYLLLKNGGFFLSSKLSAFLPCFSLGVRSLTPGEGL